MRPNAQDITAFKATLRGKLLQPGDSDYDAARVVWNGMIDRRPSIIVQCSCVADVVAAVDFARGHMNCASRSVAEVITSPGMPCATAA